MRESVFLLDKDFNSLINNNSNAQVGGGFLLGKKNNKFLVQNSKGVVSESPGKNIISLGEVNAIIGGGYENAWKNIPSMKRFKQLKGKKALLAKDLAKKIMKGGSNYPFEGEHHMTIISTPTAHCGLAPDAVDNVDSNEGILYSTQAGGAKKNYINDSFISAYMMLRLNKGKKMVGGSKVPFALGREIKNMYGDHKTYKLSESSILKKANSWRGGGVNAYRKRLNENLNILSNMEKKNKFNYSNLRDIQVPFGYLSNSYTQVGAGLPLEYFGGETENYSSENTQNTNVLTQLQSGGGVTGMPLEYYGGKTENYSSENTQNTNVLTPLQSGGGVTGMPLEYFGGKTENYSSENTQNTNVLTPLQSAGGKSKKGFKMPILSDPVIGGILKTLGIFTLPANALIPFSLLVFAYEKFISQKYADEKSLTDDKVVDTLLKAKGAFALHPMLTTAMSSI